MRAGGGGGGGGLPKNKPTNRRDLFLPKPDPVWAPSHPEIQQKFNRIRQKKGKISPNEKKGNASGSGEGGEI